MVINLLKVQPRHPADAKQRSRRARTVTLMYFSAFLSLIVTAASYAQTLKYTYDALGRVTYVVDDLNGNRDYDYDAAGNRRNVAVGTGSDAQVEPVAISNPSNLPSPTNLSYVQGSFCVYDVSWTLVPLADRYVLTDSTQNQFVATGSTYRMNSCSGTGQVTIKPSKIKACVGASCGPEAFFPANPVAPPPPPPITDSLCANRAQFCNTRYVSRRGQLEPDAKCHELSGKGPWWHSNSYHHLRHLWLYQWHHGPQTQWCARL